jgi:signal peptidase I
MSRRPVRLVVDLVETLALTLLLFFGIQTFVAQPFMIQQQSMERTLEPEQYVLVDKLSPRFSDYARGDIVVFEPPEGWDGSIPGKPFIKRVIGVPGDRIEIRDGRVSVNGEMLDEPYVFDGQPTNDAGQSWWLVPDGQLFLLGDHRAASVDSRTFGPVSGDRVIGRAWLRYWPLDTFGVLAKPTHA